MMMVTTAVAVDAESPFAKNMAVVRDAAAAAVAAVAAAAAATAADAFFYEWPSISFESSRDVRSSDAQGFLEFVVMNDSLCRRRHRSGRTPHCRARRNCFVCFVFFVLFFAKTTVPQPV